MADTVLSHSHLLAAVILATLFLLFTVFPSITAKIAAAEITSRTWNNSTDLPYVRNRTYIVIVSRLLFTVLLLFLDILLSFVLQECSVCLRTSAHINDCIVLFPDFVQYAVASTIPSALLSLSFIAYGRKLSSTLPANTIGDEILQSIDSFAIDRLNLRWSSLILSINLIFCWGVCCDYSSFCFHDLMVLRSWPFGFLSDDMHYQNVKSIAVSYERYFGRTSGPAIKHFDFFLKFKNDSEWSTLWNADGSTESERKAVVNLIQKKAQIVAVDLNGSIVHMLRGVTR